VIDADSTVKEKTALVEKICDYIKQNPTEKLTLSSLEKKFGLNKFYLQKTFKEIMGITPRKYVEECRIQVLKRNLREGVPIPSAIYKSGYNSQSWLYEKTSTKLGMPASSYRKGGEGAEIRYMISECKLGFLIVAETDHGVCALSIGDSVEQLVDSLKREFPKADIKSSDSVKERFNAVLGYFDGQLLNLPLDVQGTDFQKRVWSALRTIPYGEVRTYQQVADMIDMPKAYRAVANACASNPVPLVVPCHRVVRKDDGLGGYALGIWRKEYLLKMEKKNSDK
jgi:AraC family transcriptional regulator of adaptative response/methylated-DNA-[protein]-cysteine methyltransferase